MIKELDGIKCDCGYFNSTLNVEKYGKCKLCDKILDDKARYKYEMYVRLKLWRYKNNKKEGVKNG